MTANRSCGTGATPRTTRPDPPLDAGLRSTDGDPKKAILWPLAIIFALLVVCLIVTAVKG